MRISEIPKLHPSNLGYELEDLSSETVVTIQIRNLILLH